MRRTGPRFGYRTAHLALDLLVNRLVALVLFVPAAPVLVVLYALILIVDGPPVFYVGKRLGRHRRLFSMYKFRTLRVDAERVVGAELLSPKHRLTTRLGQILRDSRLDELPQLLNILKGDMAFVGPRPIRPIVYERVCRYIRNYDVRFRVKPGLLGLAQLVTPHNTPKRIRSMIDNLLIRKRRDLRWELWYVFLTALLVVRAMVVQLYAFAKKQLLDQFILGRYKEQRNFERVRPREGRVLFLLGDTEVAAKLLDINEEAFLMESSQRLPEGFSGVLTLAVANSFGLKGKGVRRARCTGRVYRETPLEGHRFLYVMVYDADSPLNFYYVQQYFLARSVA